MQNDTKLKLCKKYNSILYYIGVFNRGSILKKQLIQFILIEKLAKNDKAAREIIAELEHFQIVSIKNFISSKSKIIILTKLSLAYLKNKKPNQVRAKNITNISIYRSIMANHQFLLRYSKIKLKNPEYNIKTYRERVRCYSYNQPINNVLRFTNNEKEFIDEMCFSVLYKISKVEYHNKIVRLKNDKSKICTLTELGKKYIPYSRLQKKDIYIYGLRYDEELNNMYFRIDILDVLGTSSNIAIYKKILLINDFLGQLSKRDIVFQKTINIVFWNEHRCKEFEKYIEGKNMSRVMSHFNFQFESIDMVKNYLGNVVRYAF